MHATSELAERHLMAKTKDCQSDGIVFGDWKLYPLDDRNWELCHRHAASDTMSARRAGTVGEVKWHRLGRFYSWNTFANALGYTIDRELKDGTVEAARDIHAALTEYREISGRLLADMEAALARVEGRNDE